MVITTPQLHSTKFELKPCAGSNPACGVSELRNGEDLWQWSRLEIRLNAFRRSTIPQKTIHHDHHRHHHREIALKIVCKDFKSESQEWQLLIKYGCMNIHHKNLPKLVAGIFKVKNGWSPDFINDVFEFAEKPFCPIAFQVEEDPYNKTCPRNAFLPWH